MDESTHPCGTRSAFTLVELLVVIGIVAVLIGILLPALNAARAQGNLTKCKANLHSIFQALQMYANDNRDHFPGNRATLGNHPFRAAPGRTMPGRSSLQESYGLQAILHGIQPGEKDVLPLPPKPRYIAADSLVWMCPSAPDRVAKWGNTYYWTNLPIETYSMQKRHRTTINSDAYLKGSYETRTVYLADNSKFGAALTGFMGPFSGSSGNDPYNFPTNVYAHNKRGTKGGFNNLALNGEIVTDWVK